MGDAKSKPLKVPVSQLKRTYKTLLHAGGVAESSIAFKYLKDTGTVVPIVSWLNCPDSPWRVAVDFCSLLRVSTPVIAVGSHVGSALQQVSLSPGTWHRIINLANQFLFLSERESEGVALTWAV